MISDFEKKGIEQRMANWLSHPAEFGEFPQKCLFRKTYKVKLFGKESNPIHLVSFEMKNKYKGRGFVNGPLTWSFIGEEFGEINDTDLFRAYCGWMSLFPAIQNKKVLDKFESKNIDQFLADKASRNYSDTSVKQKYKIGESEIVEYVTKKNGQELKGVAIVDQVGTELEYVSTDPRTHLPMVYYILGDQAQS